MNRREQIDTIIAQVTPWPMEDRVALAYEILRGYAQTDTAAITAADDREGGWNSEGHIGAAGRRHGSEMDWGASSGEARIMRILLDINVVLDVLLNREPFVHDSRRLWDLADEGAFDACIASFSLPTIHYVCQRQAGIAAANSAVDICLEAFEVCVLYRECILAARRMVGDDFEDNLQVTCAVTDFVEGIVTRNPGDFVNSPIRVYTPAELLEVLTA